MTGTSVDEGTLDPTTHDDASLRSATSSPRHRRLVAFLAGMLAVIATTLVFIEAGTSHQGGRAEAAVARLTAEMNTRLVASASPIDFGLARSQEALILRAEGASRQVVSSEQADPAGEAIGRADSAAWQRLLIIALEIGAVPDASSPLDDYARTTLATTAEEIEALIGERNRQRDLADAASEHGSTAVWGLSLAALAGVLVGLASVVGANRSRGALLLLAYVLAGGAVVMAAIAADLVSLS